MLQLNHLELVVHVVFDKCRAYCSSPQVAVLSHGIPDFPGAPGAPAAWCGSVDVGSWVVTEDVASVENLEGGLDIGLGVGSGQRMRALRM